MEDNVTIDTLVNTIITRLKTIKAFTDLTSDLAPNRWRGVFDSDADVTDPEDMDIIYSEDTTGYRVYDGSAWGDFPPPDEAVLGDAANFEGQFASLPHVEYEELAKNSIVSIPNPQDVPATDSGKYQNRLYKLIGNGFGLVVGEGIIDFDKAPAALILPTDSYGEYITNAQNIEEYRVTIYIYTRPISESYTKQQAWEDATDLSKRVKRHIDCSRNLGLRRTLIQPVNILTIDADVDPGDSVIAEIEVLAKVISNT